MCGALSMAISSVVVNEATGFPPSEFPYTVAFLAPLTAGYILVFSTIIAFVFVPTVILFTGLISIWPMDRREDRKSVVEGHGGAIRVDLGVRALITKKKIAIN